MSVKATPLTRRPIWPQLLLFVFAYTADSVTSLPVLSNLGWEINPLLRAAYHLRGALGFLVLKGLCAMLVILTAGIAQRHPLTRGGRLAGVLLGLGSVVWLAWAFVNLAVLGAV